VVRVLPTDSQLDLVRGLGGGVVLVVVLGRDAGLEHLEQQQDHPRHRTQGQQHPEDQLVVVLWDGTNVS
jgi:hypothetical protein